LNISINVKTSIVTCAIINILYARVAI